MNGVMQNCLDFAGRWGTAPLGLNLGKDVQACKWAARVGFSGKLFARNT